MRIYGFNVPAVVCVLAAASEPGGCGLPPMSPEPLAEVQNPDTQNGAFWFGLRPVGSAATRRVELLNTSTAPAVVRSALPQLLPTISVVPPFLLIGNSCHEGLTLAPGERCALDIAFMPGAPGHVFQRGWLQLAGPRGTDFANFYLVGTSAHAGAAVSISDGPLYDFGAQAIGSSTSKGFLLLNEGLSDAVLGVVDDAALGVRPPFAVQSSSCTTGATLTAVRGLTLEDIENSGPPSSPLNLPSPYTTFCAIVVTFAPTQPGPAFGTLRVAYRAREGGPDRIASIALAGGAS